MAGYGQFCAVARALDVLGERWTLLIVRELLLGASSFGDLCRGLPRIPPGDSVCAPADAANRRHRRRLSPHRRGCRTRPRGPGTGPVDRHHRQRRPGRRRPRHRRPHLGHAPPRRHHRTARAPGRDGHRIHRPADRRPQILVAPVPHQCGSVPRRHRCARRHLAHRTDPGGHRMVARKPVLAAIAATTRCPGTRRPRTSTPRTALVHPLPVHTGRSSPDHNLTLVLTATRTPTARDGLGPWVFGMPPCCGIGRAWISS
ncbi:HxlR family transcriptional regulator [Nocardia brasiliensis ATCC 700358]|uniref:HxlR family transcriptional regulator n=1 Tax=Nocardia brasiliensis (strain ATCC 700358 / HUJEG-1) TaxID=1133849 RepID=K0ESG2_NOCB7|nr:HxlR family transcriptional regulator [Nocardia brasiliensis ATCC 700358]